ncbi:peptidase M15 superfamily [gut metagenome]|uniref:Peptidase M15 superfamily n=1 Tax=gut metagenome TaxID=749906 RepID=J9GFQ4_9ZZZZ
MKYFTMGEMMHSDTAAKKGINNKCTKEDAERLKKLIENVLDPLREAYGKPIKVTSGYRCHELNKAVGGSKTSEHCKGMAADIVGTPNTKVENKRLFYLAQSIGIKWTQLINEKNFTWVHISYNEDNLKNQVLAL